MIFTILTKMKRNLIVSKENNCNANLDEAIAAVKSLGGGKSICFGCCS